MGRWNLVGSHLGNRGRLPQEAYTLDERPGREPAVSSPRWALPAQPSIPCSTSGAEMLWFPGHGGDRKAPTIFIFGLSARLALWQDARSRSFGLAPLETR